MRGRIRFASRFAITIAASLCLAAASVAVTSPAHAYAADCIAYLKSAGYSGPAFDAACYHGESDMYACMQRLALQNVPSGTAYRACYLARF